MAQKTTRRPEKPQRTRLLGVLVKMPRSIKTPLAAEAVAAEASVNDIAVGILARKHKFEFAPSGRRPAFLPDPGTEDVVLRVPPEGKWKMQQEALDRGLNMSDYVNTVLARHYRVKYRANGRSRVPFGGGRRAAASA